MTFRACRDMAQHYGEVAEDFPIVSISEMNSHYGRVCDVIDGATQVEHVRERLRNAFFLSPTQYGYISVDTLRKNYMTRYSASRAATSSELSEISLTSLR